MHPIHDVDALVLLATGLAAKRRPAELVEIIAAADLLQGGLPAESRLAGAFQRLAEDGLIIEVEGRFALTPEAQEIVSGMPRKADTAERIFIVKEALYAFQPTGEHPPIVLTEAQLAAAIQAHRAAAQGGGKNLLMPKPKPAVDVDKRPGHWRKFASRGRKR